MNQVVLNLIVSTYTSNTAGIFVEYFDNIPKYERYYAEKYLLEPLNILIYAVNWCVSRWNGRDTMDVIYFFSYHVRAD